MATFWWGPEPCFNLHFQVACFLSRDSGYVNGTSLVVDGGHQAACR
ncbi:MAG: hypothetical protein ACFE0O_11245 [Opitutales bacterium]